jgi:hypothetical protein
MKYIKDYVMLVPQTKTMIAAGDLMRAIAKLASADTATN